MPSLICHASAAARRNRLMLCTLTGQSLSQALYVDARFGPGSPPPPWGEGDVCKQAGSGHVLPALGNLAIRMLADTLR